jgi:hypothetical protein
MDNNGFNLVGENGHSHSNWTHMPIPVIRADGVFRKFSRLSGIWLPDNMLLEGTADDVRQLLAENIKESSRA